jgi:hypothetical protein
MATDARWDMAFRRNNVRTFTIQLVGKDMTGKTMRQQVRLAPDTPGAPVIALETVTSATAEGLRLANVETVNGVPVSTIVGRYNLTTMRDKLPYGGEVGDDYPMVHEIELDGVTRFYGRWTARGTVMDSEGAPLQREPLAGRGARSAATADTVQASATIADGEVLEVVIDGAPELGALTAQAAAAAQEAKAAAASFSGITQANSVNLLDPATMVVSGKYVASSNTINNDAAWAYAKIPRPADATSIAFSSNTARRTGSTFLDAAGQPIAGAYQSEGGAAAASYTRAWPADAAFFALNVKSNTIAQPTQIMVNVGTAALPYQPYAPVTRLAEGALPTTTQKIQSGLTSDVLTQVVVTGNNLLDLTTMAVAGSYVSSSNVLVSNPAWAGVKIPKPLGATNIAWQTNTARRTGSTFLDASGQPMTGAYLSDGGAANTSCTRAWPAGAAFFFINTKSDTIAQPSEIMVNNGTAALPYEPYQGVLRYRVRADAVEGGGSGATTNAAGARAVLTVSGGGYVEAAHAGRVFRRNFQLASTPTLAASGLFNFLSDQVDGTTLRVCSDDIAPYRAFNPARTVGANHGYSQTPMTVSGGHPKTVADIGQRVSLGGAEYMIVGVPSNTVLNLSPNSDSNDAVPSGTFTYVGGGSNTSGFTATAGTPKDMYPPYQNRQSRVMVDGAPVSVSNAEYRLTRGLTVAESYDVLPKSEVMAWIGANGAGGNLAISGRDPAFSVSNAYEFDTRANVTTYSDLVALKAMSLQDIMFVQAAKTTDGIDGTVSYFIANTLPIAHPSNGVTYNFAMIAVPDTSAWNGVRLNVTPDRATGGYPDSVVMLGNTIGFAVGYLPVGDTTQAARVANATVKYLQINDGGPAKVYLSAIDKGPQTLARGDSFSTVSYRAFFVRDPKRTLQYSVFTRGADYFRVAWHNTALLDRVPVPAEFAGRPFEVVRTAGSGTVAVKSKVITDSILFDVSAAGSYADIWLKIARS